MSNNKILIIEDDKLLNEGIAFSLKNDGYDIFQAFNGEEAKSLLDRRPNLIILDINLPDTSGFKLCTYIRESINTAIIFLTAKDTEEDTIKGFKVGGDDYVTKPFSLPVLKERIKAVLNRSKKDNNYYVWRDISFDFNKLILTKNNQEIPLTATEIKLIQLFIKNRGRVLTRNQILDRVWEIEGDFIDENTLNVNIRRLRKKIEDDPTKPTIIKTVFGIGYIWGDER